GSGVGGLMGGEMTRGQWRPRTPPTIEGGVNSCTTPPAIGVKAPTPPPIAIIRKLTRRRSLVQMRAPIPNALVTLAPAMILVRSDKFHSVNRKSAIDISSKPTPNTDHR